MRAPISLLISTLMGLFVELVMDSVSPALDQKSTTV